MRVISAQDLLATRLCRALSCQEEAEPGDELCRNHRIPFEMTFGNGDTHVITKCPAPGCDAKYEGTSLRGRGWLKAHAMYCRKARALGETAVVTETHKRDRVSQPAAVSRSARPPLVPATKEVPSMSGRRLRSPEDQQQVLGIAVDQFRAFHAEHGRWPLPSDASHDPDSLPTRGLGEILEGGWQRVWDEVGAGPMPKGRGAGNYRGTNGVRVVAARAEPEPAPEPEPEPVHIAGPSGLIEVGEPGDFQAVNVQDPDAPVETEFVALAGAFEHAENQVGLAKQRLEAALDVRAQALRALKEHPLVAVIKEEL